MALIKEGIMLGFDFYSANHIYLLERATSGQLDQVKFVRLNNLS